MNYSVFTIFIFCFFSCNQTFNVEDQVVKGINIRDKIECLYCSESGESLFAGGTVRNGSGFIKYSDDSGKNWSEIYSSDGSIDYLTVINDTIFAVKNIFTGNTELTSLIIARYGQDKWSTIIYPGKIVRNIYFVSSTHWIAYIQDHNKREVLIMTKDRGQTWKEIEYFQKPSLIDYNSIKIIEENVYGIYRNHFHKDSLRIFKADLNEEFFISEKLPQKIESYGIKMDGSKQIHFFSKKENEVKYYVIDDNLSLNLVGSNQLSSNYGLTDVFYLNEEKILLLNNHSTHTHRNSYELAVVKKNGSMEKILNFEVRKFSPYCFNKKMLIGFIDGNKLRTVRW